MSRILLTAVFFFFLFSACTNEEGNKPEVQASENDLDAARNFIRAALDRNWREAKKYMLADSANVERLEKIETFYEHEDREERRGYREASINTYDARKVSDSITIVNYSNSYKNQRDSLKVLRVNGQWLVDLKYSFLPPDSIRHVP